MNYNVNKQEDALKGRQKPSEKMFNVSNCYLTNNLYLIQLILTIIYFTFLLNLGLENKNHSQG